MADNTWNDGTPLAANGDEDVSITFNENDGSNKFQVKEGSAAATLFTITDGGNVGIGITTPAELLHTATSGVNNDHFFDTYDDGTKYSILTLRKSDTDTIGTASQTDDGDTLGRILFLGVDSGSNFDRGAHITAEQDGVAGSRVPTNLVLETWGSSAINSDQLVLHNDGNIGVGTQSPGSLLELAKSSGDPEIAFSIGGTNKFSIGVDDSDSDKFKIGTTSIDTNTILTISAGSIGIGTTDPGYGFDVRNRIAYFGGTGSSIGIIAHGDSIYGAVYAVNDSEDYGFYTPDACWSSQGYAPFTGVHLGIPKKGYKPRKGEVIRVTGKVKVKEEVYKFTKKERKDIQKISVIEATSKQNDPCVCGIVAEKQSKKRDTIRYNALGTCECLVCDENSSIKAGDLLTTSSVKGYAMKQDDDIIRSYTLGKAREKFSKGKGIIQIYCYAG